MPRHARIRGPLRRTCRGIATIEYTLLLGLLVTCVLGTWLTLGEAGRNSTAALNDHLIGQQSARIAAAQAPPEPAAVATTITDRTSIHGGVWLGPLVLTAVAVGSMSWQMLRARRHKQIDRRGDPLADLPRGLPRGWLFEKRQEILKFIEHDMCALLEGRLQVRHLMSTDPLTVTEDCPAAEVKERMAQRGTHHLMVCDADGTLLGVISDRDLARGTGSCARDIMTREVVTVAPDMLLSPAVTLLIDRRISSLPVLEHGKPCGVLTTTDLIMALQCTLQAMLKVAGGGTRAGDAPASAALSGDSPATSDWNRLG